MSAAAQRAESVAVLPHVKRWISRFRRLAKDMPPEVWVYVANGSPYVMARNEDGQMFERAGASGTDQDAIVDNNISRSNGGWDGGDW